MVARKVSMASEAIRTSSIASVTVAGSPDSTAARRFVAAISVASSAAWNAARMTGPTWSSDASSTAAWPSAPVVSRLSMAASAAAFSGVPSSATSAGSRASSSSRSAWISVP
jgi:hypothetical protein